MLVCFEVCSNDLLKIGWKKNYIVICSNVPITIEYTNITTKLNSLNWTDHTLLGWMIGRDKHK